MSTPVSTAGPAATTAAHPTPPTQHLTQPPTRPAAPRALPISPLSRAWTTLTLELGKLRRKRYWLIAASATAVCLAWSSMLITQRASGPVGARHATLALDEFIQIIAFLMPLITAILASRIVTVDTEERMGQLMTALGQSALTRYRGKLVIVILTVLCMETALFTLVTVLAGPIGLTVTGSYCGGVLNAGHLRGPADAVHLLRQAGRQPGCGSHRRPHRREPALRLPREVLMAAALGHCSRRHPH